MDKYFILQFDRESGFVRILEGQMEYTGKGQQQVTRSIDDEAVIYGHIGARLYGKMEAFFVSREKIENAPPVEPEIA